MGLIFHGYTQQGRILKIGWCTSQNGRNTRPARVRCQTGVDYKYL